MVPIRALVGYNISQLTSYVPFVETIIIYAIIDDFKNLTLNFFVFVLNICMALNN